MTISYSGKFGKLLFRWKASLWKSVWFELAVFLLLYYSLAIMYRYGLQSPSQCQEFARLASYLNEATSNSIPISFLLGMYVVAIVKRWWEQFENVAWPDNLLFMVSAFFPAGDEETLLLRRTIARYAVLTAVLAWRNVSSRVLKRFPTAAHVTQAGLMTTEECLIYEQTDAPFGRWFLPINWVKEIIVKEHLDGTLDSAQARQLLTTLLAYKDKFVRQFVFDWITIPLVYTQVCTVATYGYFGLCLIGRQFVDDGRDHYVNIYFPIFTTLEFLFYMGWLKVAERLMHPFGDEDDDFELNYILDRHLYVAFMIVDGLHGKLPHLEKDSFWGKEPWLPHTKASNKIKERRPHSLGTALPFQEMELEAAKSELD